MTNLTKKDECLVKIALGLACVLALLYLAVVWTAINLYRTDRTLETFRLFAAGTQALTVSVAVLLGGIWAGFRFFSLREIFRAKKDLEAKERALK